MLESVIRSRMATKTTSAANADEVFESLANSGASIDREASLIKGVKIVGFESRNGRTYPASVLQEAASLYEGVRVNLDHPDSTGNQQRSVKDRFGTFQAVRFVEGKGLFGDLKFNPKHAIAEQVLWAAENDPKSIGFSHVATVKAVTGHGGKSVVEAISRVRHVDLVADPATTNGVFESHNPADEADSTESDVMDLTKLTLSELKVARNDIVEAIVLETNAAHKPQLDELAALKAEIKQRDLVAAVEAEIAAAGAGEVVTDTFKRLLLATESVDARKELIADRVGVAATKFTKPFTTVAEGAGAGASEFKASDLMK
jgi:hypothetical protein